MGAIVDGPSTVDEPTQVFDAFLGSETPNPLLFADWRTLLRVACRFLGSHPTVYGKRFGGTQ